MGSVPFAATLKLAREPVTTVRSTGCEVIVTGVFTVSVALALETLPAGLVTITLYVPASTVCAVLIV